MNEKIFNILENSFNENKNSHAFLMETNNLEKCLDDIINFIFSINDLNCVKKLENMPDIKVVFPEGKEIKRDQISVIIDEFQTYPIELKHRYYIIVQSDVMNQSSANTILKFLEEPDNFVIGFFITKNKSAMINTIVSRCQSYKLLYDSLIILNDNEIKSFFENMNNIEIYKKINFLNNFIKKDRNENILLLKKIKSNLLNDKIDNFDNINLLVKRINLLDNVIERLTKNANQELVILDLARNWK